MLEYTVEGTVIGFPGEGFSINLDAYQGDRAARIDVSRDAAGMPGVSFERPPEICIEIPARDVRVVKTGEADDAGIQQIKRLVKPLDMSKVSIISRGENEAEVTAEFPADRIAAERAALENRSGGKNTIITDDIGRPSVMVRVPKFRWSDVYDGAGDEICSAFIAGGREVDHLYISKYLNIVEYGRAYSIYGRDPANSLTIDEAREACARKGRGWHLLTNAEWCAIAHLCEKRGIRPGGNTSKGSDALDPRASGEPAQSGHRIDESITERTLTGTGPESWSHDGTAAGIYDMVGNVWEHVAGLRLVDGEIQIIKDNDSALGVDESAQSGSWRAITRDGKLTGPGEPLTCKYDSLCMGSASLDIAALPQGFALGTEVTRPQYTGENAGADGAYAVMPLRVLKTNGGFEPAALLTKLGLAPVSGDSTDQLFFMRNYGERMPQRGGSWYDGAFAGMWELYMRDGRDYVYPDMGFRSAYVDISI
ncbi:MAG: SUMF1/EgtB/PvdO family nonheme iron enzyme [Clostridiales Family XIII bacterium]|jgi:hypothetical protein|nr:SUMF1/EgtB/PvdO family nonheme iron enzyme [Clostridiales Family XIII bacterium]